MHIFSQPSPAFMIMYGYVGSQWDFSWSSMGLPFPRSLHGHSFLNAVGVGCGWDDSKRSRHRAFDAFCLFGDIQSNNAGQVIPWKESTYFDLSSESTLFEDIQSTCWISVVQVIPGKWSDVIQDDSPNMASHGNTLAVALALATKMNLCDTRNLEMTQHLPVKQMVNSILWSNK